MQIKLNRDQGHLLSNKKIKMIIMVDGVIIHDLTMTTMTILVMLEKKTNSNKILKIVVLQKKFQQMVCFISLMIPKRSFPWNMYYVCILLGVLLPLGSFLNISGISIRLILFFCFPVETENRCQQQGRDRTIIFFS